MSNVGSALGIAALPAALAIQPQADTAPVTQPPNPQPPPPDTTPAPTTTTTAPAIPVHHHWYSDVLGKLTPSHMPNIHMPSMAMVKPGAGQTYQQAVTDPNTGQPNPAAPNLTKLGKVFTVLTMLAKGAAEGSGHQYFGQGFQAAQEAQRKDIQDYVATQGAAQQRQLGDINMKIAQQNLAQMPWKIAREHEVSDLDLQIKKAQAAGETPVYTREKDGTYTLQRYDRDGNPVGKPIHNVGTGAAIAAATKPPHLQSKAIINPHDPTDTKPYAANYNNITGGYEEDDEAHTPIPGPVHPFPSAQVAKEIPAAGTPAAAAAYQAGPPPKADATPEERAAYGKKLETIINRMAQAKAASPNDIRDITDAIVRGDQPPDLKSLYRAGPAIRAELSRRKFNLAAAQRDWNAVVAYYKNLNNSQQVRLGQNVRNADGMLERIEDLYKQWQATGLPGGYKIWNRAALQASKQLPGEAGKTATMLDQQIAEFTADMGNVLMGGNSPTDHALTLAGQIMSGDWNNETFTGAVQNAHWNIKNRRNAIESGEPIGVSENSPYINKPTNTPATKTPPPKGGTASKYGQTF